MFASQNVADRLGAILVGYTFVTYASALLFGVPLYHLLKWKRWLSWWQIAMASFMVGLPFGVIVGQDSSVVGGALVFGLIGGLHGLLFWILVFWRNEDREAC
jgi:hypothetical protein